MLRKEKKPQKLSRTQIRMTMGDQLNFAAAEAYRLLRTNLNFSLPDKDGCKIIGVTSALQGEGKSTTAVNLAYTMAQTGHRVLLLEADLRLPTLAKRMGIQEKPGLANLLVGQCSGNDIIRNSGMLKNFWVATAGDIPPNPAELLGSDRMSKTVQALSEVCDVLIVDLPPVTAVSDALIVSKLVDGMVLVVRQNFCERWALETTVRQLRFADAKILGFIMTGSDLHQKNYKRYGGDYKLSVPGDD